MSFLLGAFGAISVTSAFINPAGFPGRWIMGALLTLLFAALARWLRGVTNGGALAGAVSCFFLYAGGGPGAFAALITVFALTWITTRLGYSRKQRLGVAEKREGRDAWQVLANLGVAAACSAFYAFGNLGHTRAVLLLAASAALSEAAADTASSEVGQALGRKARLITTWKSVPAGTNGAVSPAGTLAALVAASLVSLVGFTGGLIPRAWLVFSIAAAIFGTLVDSLLGAWLERRGLLNNNSVNFLSTLVAAGAAFWLAQK